MLLGWVFMWFFFREGGCLLLCLGGGGGGGGGGGSGDVVYGRGESYQLEAELLCYSSCEFIRLHGPCRVGFHQLWSLRRSCTFTPCPWVGVVNFFNSTNISVLHLYFSFCWLVGCLTFQQHTSVSRGSICSDTLYVLPHTETEVADPTLLPHPFTVY